MVNKTSVQEPQKAVKKPAPKKVSSKAIAPKKAVVKSEIKNVEEKLIDKQVPVKEDVNPIEQVLAIKSRNEEKKANTKAAKTLRKPVKKNSAPAEEKGNKVSGHREKVLEVKNTAQKVASRKLADENAAVSAKETTCCSCCKNGAWAAWTRVYKNIFNYKGRTSRYEFWSFMLINLFFALIFGYGVSLLFSLFTSLEIGTLYLAVFLAVSFLAILSLSVRRIHDIGYSAWNGFYKQLTFSFIAFLITIILTGFVAASQNQTGGENWWGIVSVDACLLLLAASFLVISYYSTKIGIAVTYFEGKATDNAYGKVLYTDENYKMLSLRYASIFCVTVSVLYTISFIIGIISGYMSASQANNLL